MNLIERYVREVGKHLPAKSRDDIQKELKSTLEDMLEDRAEKSGRARDEELEIELLKEYGAPDKVADTYHSTQYLIGPRMFPMFLMVLKIVGTVLSVMAVVGLGLALREVGFAGQEFARTLMQTIFEYIGIAITAFGNIVVVFAILERVISDSDIKGMKTTEEWDPSVLLKEQDPDMVKRGDLVAEIIFTFAGLVILNYYPTILGIHFPINGEWFFIPMFSDVFFRFLPWINIIWLTQAGLNLYLLRQNSWSTLTRVVKIIIETASLAITVVILLTPNIIGFTAESFINSPIDLESAQALATIFKSMFPVILVVIIIIQGVELAKAIYNLWKVNYKMK